MMANKPQLHFAFAYFNWGTANTNSASISKLFLKRLGRRARTSRPGWRSLDRDSKGLQSTPARVPTVLTKWSFQRSVLIRVFIHRVDRPLSGYTQ